MSDFMGIAEMIDAQLLRRHNNTAREFFEVGQEVAGKSIIRLLQDKGYLCGKGSREHGQRCAWRIVDGECACKDIVALIESSKTTDFTGSTLLLSRKETNESN